MPNPPPSPASSPRNPPWLWPHIASLEAPLVAVLWLAALAHMNDLRLMPGVSMGLGLAVWIIYLVDRVLDTFGVPAAALGPRHRFYLRFRPWLLLLVIPAALAWLVWLALWVVPAGLLAHSLAQVIPIGIYLVLFSVKNPRARSWLIQGGMLLLLLFVNALPVPFLLRLTVTLLIAGATVLALTRRWHERVEAVFRKEVAAGLLFAFGCTTWTRFHTFGSESPEYWVELLLLALLFVGNLTLISARESLNSPPGEAGHPVSTPATARGALVVTLLILGAVLLGRLPASLMGLTLCVLGGTVGMELLWRQRTRLSAEAFRVWADVLVALPAAVLLGLG